MENFRISTRNNINSEIKQTENIIKRNNDTIERLRNTQSNFDFNKKQIEKLSLSQVDYENNLVFLKQKYIDIGLGLYDKDFLNNKIESQSKLEKSNEKQTKKNEEKVQKKIQDKEILDNEYKLRRFNGPSESHLKKETDRFFKLVDTIPNFILDNLKNMPSNKGYIWRGVNCYGELPVDGKNTIMFEKCKNGIMKIHEYINDKIYIYEKSGKGPKKLIETINRNNYLLSEIDRLLASIEV